MIKMSTSILDYIFRELAVSYLDRSDLGHVKPDDLDAGTTGGGESQSDLDQARISSGFIRNRNIVVLRAGDNDAVAAAGGDTAITAQAATTASTAVTSGAADSDMGGGSDVTTQIKQAKMQGYEGENCSECGNFTLVRNGTCLKCNTCGATTGCS